MFACGRYEGIDARVAEHAATRMRVDELSLGDYVLAGGEVAVLVIVEAVARLLPGVLGNAESAEDDSFAAGPDGLLEAPAYTRPASWRGLDVPPVLLSGNHAEIAAVARGALPPTNRRAPARPALSLERHASADRPTSANVCAERRPVSVSPAGCGIIVGLPARARRTRRTRRATHRSWPRMPIRRAAGC